MSSDILFLSPTVITGEEDAQPFVADVLVSNGLIAQIGQPGSIYAPSARQIDAKGDCLAPGFIDMNAHSDLYLLTNATHEAKITQGCTVRTASFSILQPEIQHFYMKYLAILLQLASNKFSAGSHRPGSGVSNVYRLKLLDKMA